MSSTARLYLNTQLKNTRVKDSNLLRQGMSLKCIRHHTYSLTNYLASKFSTRDFMNNQMYKSYFVTTSYS